MYNEAEMCRWVCASFAHDTSIMPFGVCVEVVDITPVLTSTAAQWMALLHHVLHELHGKHLLSLDPCQP